MIRRLGVFSVAMILCTSLAGQTVEILYDGPLAQSEAFKTACYIENLLGHFRLQSCRISSIRAASDRFPGGTSHIFVVCEEGIPEFPQLFVDHLLQSKAEIIWLHMHSEFLLNAAPGRFGLQHLGYDERNDWKISYKGESFPKEDPLLNLITVSDHQKAAVISPIADDDGNHHPYIIHSDKLWLFCDSPFSFAREGGRFLILADLLHEILRQEHPLSHQAMVRIEDINPDSDPQGLNAITRTLHREKVPWQFALIPIFIDPAEQAEIYLSDRPKLIQSLQKMVDHGATPVLHGITHQNRGISGDDYEFWDDITGVPIAHETANWAEQRMQLGLKECFRNGIYPLSWETPHYSASSQDYQIFARFFDTFYDRVMAAELPGTQQIFPYPIFHRRYGVTIIPENLGYIDQTTPDPQPLLDAARRMRVVRDGMASFFFHPFVAPAILRRIVREMKKMGWDFISIRDFPANLTTETCWVTTSGGSRDIVAANQYIHRQSRNRNGKKDLEEFSEKRLQGIFTQIAHPPKGSIWVSEAVDFLPIKPKRLPRRIFEAVRSIGKRLKTDEILFMTRSMIILNKQAEGMDRFDQESFQFVLKMLGFRPQSVEIMRIATLRLDAIDLLIIPQASAKLMQAATANLIADWTRSGGIVITDGPSPLLDRFNIGLRQSPIKVKGIRELIIPVENPIWTETAEVQSLVDPALTPLATDDATGQPLVGMKPYGKGKILAFSTRFEPRSPFGTSRFPYFSIYLKNSLGLPFHFRRNNLECYFDPGFHPHTSWEKLVKQWKESGIRVIYLATWHWYETYRFDYEYFIGLCHHFGIAVYAWFESPQVSPAFWQQYPQWREKTASGKDALCHWRLQMNLFNPAARAAAGRFFREILGRYEWDGINLAEINFDTNRGTADPDKFTPMNRDIRNAFQKQTGVDPSFFFQPQSPQYWKKKRLLFDRFLRFRANLTVDLHRFFLNEAEQVRKTMNRDIEIIVTVMDSLCHPEIYEECGIDTRDIIRLMDRYDFTLQVEDPARSWIDPPDRYLKYYEIYKKWITNPRRLMFDINCIPNRDIRSRPLSTNRPAGAELAAAFFYAVFPSGRAAIYSEHTVSPVDLDLLSYILGSDIDFSRSRDTYSWKAREPFILSFPLRSGQVPYINGMEWPFRDNRNLYLPAGEGTLKFRKRNIWAPPERSFQILYDGPVSSLTSTAGGGFRLVYNARLPVPMTTNRPFHSILLDNRPVFIHSETGGLVLPRGSHVLTLVPDSPTQQTVDQVGYLSSTLFSIIGFAAVMTLAALYILSRKRK